MACTMEQLQNAEYEILCTFADFCEQHNLSYSLAYGTLLGAIRHDGFIPWDDDVDLVMNIRDFKKAVRLFKKEQIPGYTFCWFTLQKDEYPFFFGKFRKDNTYMPEPIIRNLKMHQGVWIDVFIYFNKPKQKWAIGLQEYLLGLSQATGNKYYYQRMREAGKDIISNSRLNRLINKCPDFIVRFFRKVTFALASRMGSEKSERIRLWGDSAKSKDLPRKLLDEIDFHIFKERIFRIPKNYDEYLTLYYNDYMTPVKSHIHVDLKNIELNTNQK